MEEKGRTTRGRKVEKENRDGEKRRMSNAKK